MNAENLRVGYGYDIHRLVPGRPLILGGVRFDHPLGLQGHSDADVVLHAITDALLSSFCSSDCVEDQAEWPANPGRPDRARRGSNEP